MKSFESVIDAYKGVQIAKKRLERVEEQLAKQYALLFDFDLRLEKEFKDVERLVNLSLYNLFYTVLGDKEQQYEIEKQEYLTAIMHYKKCKNIVELLEFERDVLKEKIAKEPEIKAILDALILSGLKEIEEKYPGAAFDLKYLNTQHTGFLEYMREVREAYGVSLKVRELFDKMITLLRQAQRAETWGYSYVERQEMKKVKSSSLDKAQRLSYQIKPLLDRFHSELLDVYKLKSLTTNRVFPELDFCTDIYYDRLITDWIEQERILGAITHLEGTLERVTSISKSLKIEIDSTQTQIDYVVKRRKTILLDYVHDDIKKDA